MENLRIALPASWKRVLLQEFQQPYMHQLRQFLLSELRAGKQIFPKSREYFNAFYYVPFEEVKVVILGQDPYHGVGQAHGLAFSVQPHVSVPPSLKNIFKELKQDVGIDSPTHGCLTSWSRQGVLLLNATLTVESGRPGSHQNKGWEIFTDRVIHVLNEQRDHLVFMLWGAYAQRKGVFINNKKHLVLKSSHPSPFSSDRGFFGCAHFSKANRYLQDHHIQEIDWNIQDLRHAQKS